MTGTTASTASAFPSITIEGLQRAVAEVERLGAPRSQPFRLTESEYRSMLPHLKVSAASDARTLFGVPMVVIKDDHPLAALDFASRDAFLLEYAP